MTISTILRLAVLSTVSFFALGAQAALIDFSEGASIDAAESTTLDLTIVGSGFGSSVDAGAYAVTWNETVLDYVSTSIFQPPWDFPAVFSKFTPTGRESSTSSI